MSEVGVTGSVGVGVGTRTSVRTRCPLTPALLREERGNAPMSQKDSLVVMVAGDLEGGVRKVTNKSKRLVGGCGGQRC